MKHTGGHPCISLLIIILPFNLPSIWNNTRLDGVTWKWQVKQGWVYLSVRKVVPTLTSKSAEIYLSMAGAKQHNDTGLSWFRPWVVRPAGVRSGCCIASHCGACRGELQARRERSRSLQEPKVWLWVEMCKCAAIRRPLQLGDRLLLL
jgi:hypothetical protein